MRLRATIEELLPIYTDEVKLNPDEQKALFTGGYVLHGEVWTSLVDTNTNPKTCNEKPHLVRIGRLMAGDGGDFADYSRPHAVSDEVLATIKSSEGMARATRVEKIARRIKIGTFTMGITVAAIASTVDIPLSLHN